LASFAFGEETDEQAAEIIFGGYITATKMKDESYLSS
jgi:hypothetical protein